MTVPLGRYSHHLEYSMEGENEREGDRETEREREKGRGREVEGGDPDQLRRSVVKKTGAERARGLRKNSEEKPSRASS